MPIYVANDIGSKEFAPALRAHINCDVKVREMKAGDFAWPGNGPTGRVYVGLERKAIGDMLNSMRSSRYAGFQLPNMGHEFDVCYLLIEGMWRPGPGGAITFPVKRNGRTEWLNYQEALAAKVKRYRNAADSVFMYSELDKHLCTIENQKNVIVVRSTMPSFPDKPSLETVHQIINRFQWWQKPWSEHSSADPIKLQTEISFSHITWARKFASILPGVGWKKSKEIANYFRTIDNMVIATRREWMQIPGVGKQMAENIMKVFRSEE